ncbi:UDP-N-acetylmuramoyl-tripeptide--D-alanyl-D-alanine ligase [bacterium]|nr:UDP-N-acetylmuramoyl-tripeptide--D-alanyl-D-alanine ligase [bacterium]
MNIKLSIIRDRLPEFEIINFEDVEITGVNYDTREIKGGEIFFPLKGENFDGHDYISQAFDGGAVVSLCESEHVGSVCDLGKPIIVVDSIKEGLEKVVNTLFSDIPAPIVAITGSTGKTTTRDMLVSILKGEGSVLSTDTNLNTLWGNAKVLSEYDDHKYIVLELGMDSPGEIGWACRALEPDLGAILNIGYVHAENVGGIENVYKVKKDLADYLHRTGKPLVLNNDDQWLKEIESSYTHQLLTYGYSGQDFRLIDSKVSKEGTTFVFIHKEREYECIVGVYGKEMAYNALAAIALADLLGVSVEKSVLALASYKGFAGRFEIVDFSENVTVVNDAYNANPTSMRMAINTFDEVFDKGEYERVVILGDMKELGEVSSEQHRLIGELVNTKGFDRILYVGDFFTEFGVGERLDNWQEAKKVIEELSGDNEESVVLIKASHGIGLYNIVE